MCQVSSVSGVECVRCRVCQVSSVSGVECVRCRVCQVSSVSSVECQVSSVSGVECVRLWVCQIVGVSDCGCVMMFGCRGEVDLALQTMETMEAAFKDREYLCILLKYLVTHGHPLQVWQQRLSFSPSEMLRWNTVLFFAYIDCGDLDLAEEMYKVNAFSVIGNGLSMLDEFCHRNIGWHLIVMSMICE